MAAVTCSECELALPPHQVDRPCPRCGTGTHRVVSTPNDAGAVDPQLDEEGYVHEVLRNLDRNSPALFEKRPSVSELDAALTTLKDAGGLLLGGVSAKGRVTGLTGNLEADYAAVEQSAKRTGARLDSWGSMKLEGEKWVLFAIVEPPPHTEVPDPWRSREEMGFDVFRAIRATRAHPPGLATSSGRRVAYRAALQQFEELMAAAEAATAASRPLLLYYAITQAGIACISSFSPVTEFKPHHGLNFPRLPDQLLRREIKPLREGLLPAFCQAVGEQRPRRPLTIGELWRSLPELARHPIPTPNCRPALLVSPYVEGRFPGWSKLPDPRVAAVVHIDGVANYDDVARELKHYPTTAGWHAPGAGAGIQYAGTDQGMGVVIYWSANASDIFERSRKLDAVAPEYRDMGRWLLPAIGGLKGPMHPIITWWILLYGLSMVCRYEPVAWGRALDVDRSEIAAALEVVMEQAIAAVPELIHELLTSGLGAVDPNGQTKLL